MMEDDQHFRWMLTFGELDEGRVEAYKKMDLEKQTERMVLVRKGVSGISAAQRDSLTRLQEQLDSINFEKLSTLILQFGCPAGYFDVRDISVVWMHNTRRINDAMLAFLLTEVKEDCMPAQEYAMIYDRVQLDKKLPERYFVIEHYDTVTGTYSIGKPADINATNQARREIGLKKLTKR